MAGAKEIRSQISSVENTKKITKAMEMVAASKMRKAQQRMVASRPYATKMRNVIGHLAQAHPEYKHPYLVDDADREVKRVGYIVVSSDRGLCGGLNSNLFRKLAKEMIEWQEQKVEVDLVVIGRKASDFFKRLSGINMIASKQNIGDTPHISELIGVVKTMLDSFNEETIDRLFLASNVFVNTMTQKPTVLKMLPVDAGDVSNEDLAHHWDYLYEPDSKEILDALLMRFIESQVYQGVVENIACEQSARMIAMKSSTDNAGELISALRTKFNKARQAAITQEISEIVGGAAAV